MAGVSVGMDVKLALRQSTVMDRRLGDDDDDPAVA